MITEKPDVTGYLASKGFAFRVNGEQALLNCPFCNDTETKFSISLATGLWKCWHSNRCGKKGNFRQLQEQLGDTPRREAPPTKYATPEDSPTAYDAKTRDWFRGRGITEETIKIFGIGTLRDGRIGFPHIRGGKVVNLKKRSLKEKRFEQTQGAQQLLYGADFVTKGSPELFIVEGEIDAMSLAQVGVQNVVSVPNGAESLKWIEHDAKALDARERIYLCLDADEAGDRGSAKIAERLGPWRCHRVRPPKPFKDWNDALVAGLLTAKWFGELALRASDMAPDDLVVPEDILDELLEPDPPGLDTGLPTLDKKLGGLRAGEVTLVTGRSWTGKSVITNQIALAILERYDHARVMFCSLELPRKVLMNWLCEALGMIPGRSSYESLFELFRRRVRIYAPRDSVTADALLDAMECGARRNGIHLVVIDSLMCIAMPGEDQFEAQRNIMRRLNGFADLHHCHVMLISHPRKGFSDTSDVGLVDIAGSADLGNLAWNAVAMQRYVPDKAGAREVSSLKILKNRVRGIRGTIELRHDENKRRFAEV